MCDRGRIWLVILAVQPSPLFVSCVSMEVPGGCLEVMQQPMLDDADLQSGRITHTRLHDHFDFVSVGADVSVQRVWPCGPFIVVHFHSTAQLVDVFPVLIVRELRTLSCCHACSLSSRMVKSDYVCVL